MRNDKQKVIRVAAGAGRWFPADGAALRSMINGYLGKAPPAPVTGRIVAAITPHAGYQYSGATAAHVFRAIRDQAAKGMAPDTVVIIGFSHRIAFSGVALLDGDALRTPLGEAVLDRDAMEFLVKRCAVARQDARPHHGEHSAENEVPFVQAVLPEARLVVALMGDHNPETIDSFVAALHALAGEKKTLVIASTDMLHDPDYDLVSKTDRETLKITAAMDSARLLEQWTPHHQIYCGIAAVVTAMNFARQQGCRQGTVLHYRNSGDDHPESRGQWVVGYGALVFALPDS